MPVSVLLSYLKPVIETLLEVRRIVNVASKRHQKEAEIEGSVHIPAANTMSRTISREL